MLPQTNLQLYGLMIERRADDAALGAMRAAYDAARQLFSASFRPSHKPFVAHLVGVAGACVRWGERIEVAVAGMLHSAYLYGAFGDGDRGASPRRREWLRGVVGGEAESLIDAYTLTTDWRRTIDEYQQAERTNGRVRDLAAIKLADVLDDLCDGGSAYCPQKPHCVTALRGEAAEREIAQWACTAVSQAAAKDFEQAFATLRHLQAPTCLVTDDRSYHVLEPGVPELRRSAWGQKLVRLRTRSVRGAAA